VLFAAVAAGIYRREVGSAAITALKISGVSLSTGKLPHFNVLSALFGITAGAIEGGEPSERVFSLEELSTYDGSANSPTAKNPRGQNGEGDVYLSIGGIVFDVTEKGRHFYGTGYHYHCFAATPVSRALTLGSLEVVDIELGDSIEDFTERQLSDLRSQVQFYSDK
jgi:predicted heme/steroid binding protein